MPVEQPVDLYGMDTQGLIVIGNYQESLIPLLKGSEFQVLHKSPLSFHIIGFMLLQETRNRLGLK